MRQWELGEGGALLERRGEGGRGGGGEGVHGGEAPPRVTFRRVAVPLWGPGQSPVLPFACCVGSLLSVGRCGPGSCWSPPFAAEM